MKLINKTKTAALKVLYPFQSIQTIKYGFLKNYKIQISENSGWSPLFNRWEPEILYWFSRLIKEKDVVYDLGANNGLHTMLASKLAPQGFVYAFEPMLENAKEIQTNLSLNSIKNCKIINCAVYDDSSDNIHFKVGKHNKQGSIDGIGCETGEELTIKTISLNDFINQGNQQPNFIKIDIEGAESKALEGFNKYLPQILPTMIIDLHTPEQDEQVGKILLENGYEVYRILKKRKLFKIKDLTKPYPHPNGIWGSIIAIHPSKNILL